MTSCTLDFMAFISGQKQLRLNAPPKNKVYFMKDKEEKSKSNKGLCSPGSCQQGTVFRDMTAVNFCSVLSGVMVYTEKMYFRLIFPMKSKSRLLLLVVLSIFVVLIVC